RRSTMTRQSSRLYRTAPACVQRLEASPDETPAARPYPAGPAAAARGRPPRGLIVPEWRAPQPGRFLWPARRGLGGVVRWIRVRQPRRPGVMRAECLHVETYRRAYAPADPCRAVPTKRPCAWRAGSLPL